MENNLVNKKRDLNKKQLLLDSLVEKSESRDYRGRTMILAVTSRKDDDGFYTVIGDLKIRVSENPEDENSWKEVPFGVKVIDNNEGAALQQAVSTLNAIPSRYQDGIFEDGFGEIFEDAVSLAEGK